MADKLGPVLAGLGIGLVMLCNAIVCNAKRALRCKGYRVNPLIHTPFDFAMIDRAVSEETDPAERKRLRRIQKSMRAIWIIFPISMALFIAGVLLGPLPE